MDIDQIAKSCHEAHNVILRIYSQPTIPWEEKTNSHKKTVKDSIEKILSGEIESAQQAHVNFVQRKVKDGWTYSTTYSQEGKTSPRICKFEDLSPMDLWLDEMFFSLVKSFV